MRSNRLLWLGVAAALAAAASGTHAEPGDYSTLQTARNLLFPPGPSHPVTPAERTGPFPLLSNPPGFDDGFEPGAYGVWQTIQLHPDTGTVCGNGSPYKFFVNLV